MMDKVIASNVSKDGSVSKCVASVPTFFKYMKEGVPVVIDSSSVSSWKSRKAWVAPDGRPHFKYLNSVFKGAGASVNLTAASHFLCSVFLSGYYMC